MKRLVYITILFALIPLHPVQSGGKGSIVETKHNLSTSGRGDIKSPTETRVCIFCHSSHNASKEGPLWNHQTSTRKSFTTYQRPTMSGQSEQPNGATKLCLSCHDGTIAVGAVRGLAQPIVMKNVGAGGELPTAKKSNFGLDLSGTHPVSVKYKQSSALAVDHLRWPPLDPEKSVGPDAEGYVQCTSCHDPHDNSKSDRYPFWKKATFDEVCLTCHTF